MRLAPMLFGLQVRDPSNTKMPAKAYSDITLRGFTGHEQLDEVGLVHMGGRVCAPILERFPDPESVPIA